jgi:hypothetical protein
MIVAFLLVIQISFSQNIQRVNYSWHGPLYGINKEFLLNIENGRLEIVLNRDSLDPTIKRISNKKIDNLLDLLKDSTLAQIPDSTLVGFDGTLYFLKIVYTDGSTKIYRAWSSQRVKQFILISNYFEHYSPLKRKDYPEYKKMKFYR